MLAHNARAAFLEALDAGDRVAGDLLALGVAETQAAVSHHLALLRLAGLVDVRRSGKFSRCTITEAGRFYLGLWRSAEAYEKGDRS